MAIRTARNQQTNASSDRQADNQTGNAPKHSTRHSRPKRSLKKTAESQTMQEGDLEANFQRSQAQGRQVLTELNETETNTQPVSQGKQQSVEPELNQQDSNQTTETDDENSAVELITFDNQESGAQAEPVNQQDTQELEQQPEPNQPQYNQAQNNQPQHTEALHVNRKTDQTMAYTPEAAQNPQAAAAETVPGDLSADPYQAAAEPARGIPVLEVMVSLDAQGQQAQHTDQSNLQGQQTAQGKTGVVAQVRPVNPNQANQAGQPNQAAQTNQPAEPVPGVMMPEVHLEDLPDVSRDNQDELEELVQTPNWVAAQTYAENENLKHNPPVLEEAKPAEEYLAERRKSPEPSPILRAAAHNAKLAAAADAKQAPDQQRELTEHEQMEQQMSELAAADQAVHGPGPQQKKAQPNQTKGQSRSKQRGVQSKDAKAQAELKQSQTQPEPEYQKIPDMPTAQQPTEAPVETNSVETQPAKKNVTAVRKRPQVVTQSKQMPSETSQADQSEQPQQQKTRKTSKKPLTERAKKQALSQSQRDPQAVVDEIMQRIQQSKLGEDHELLMGEQADYQPSQDGVVRVSDVMTTEVACVLDSITVEQLASLFNKRQISAVPVVHAQSKRYLGLVTITDIFSRAFSEKMLARSSEQNLLKQPIRIFMDSEEALTVNPDCSLQEACQVMVEHQLHHLVISDQFKVRGIFSAFDALKFLAEHDCQS